VVPKAERSRKLSLLARDPIENLAGDVKGTANIGSPIGLVVVEAQIAEAPILRSLLCDEVGDLGERLRGGDTDAGWNSDPALDSHAKLPRKRLTSLWPNSPRLRKLSSIE
jgi:hypothetical protein